MLAEIRKKNCELQYFYKKIKKGVDEMFNMRYNQQASSKADSF